MDDATDEIDQLLTNFSRELDYFVYTRDKLEPVMDSLLGAVERYLADREDMVALTEARVLRTEYVSEMQGMSALLEDWVRIRGSGERLWEAEPMMSQVQFDRFEGLNLREQQVAQGRAVFDALQERMRRMLLLFEEMTA